MFEYNNREYRSLQEQVKFNTDKIIEHYNRDRILADLGIKIMGQANTVGNLPDTPPGGAEAYGEAYAVGNEAPYNIYIWTRPDDTHPDAYWFDIGQIAIKGDKGDPGTTISRATINANNQLVLTMTDGSTITVPGNLKGDTGPSPKIYLSNVDDGVQIKVENPDGSSSYTTVKNGTNGQNGKQGIQGPPGYFNILGALTNEGQLPSASSVETGSAYLIWHAVAEEENGGHYDLYIIVQSGGGYVWQNTGRVSAGTYVYEDGQPITQFNADTKLNAYTNSGGGNKVYGTTNDGNQTMYILRPDPQTGTSGNYKNQVVQYDVVSNKNTGLIRIAETPTQDYHTASKKYVDDKVFNTNVLQSCIAVWNGEAEISFYRSVSRSNATQGYDFAPNYNWQACSGATTVNGYTIVAFQNYGWSGEDGDNITYIRCFNRDTSEFEERTIYGNPSSFSATTLN